MKLFMEIIFNRNAPLSISLFQFLYHYLPLSCLMCYVLFLNYYNTLSSLLSLSMSSSLPSVVLTFCMVLPPYWNKMQCQQTQKQPGSGWFLENTVTAHVQCDRLQMKLIECSLYSNSHLLYRRSVRCCISATCRGHSHHTESLLTWLFCLLLLISSASLFPTIFPMAYWVTRIERSHHWCY